MFLFLADAARGIQVPERALIYCTRIVEVLRTQGISELEERNDGKR